jgi:hypothetical protein
MSTRVLVASLVLVVLGGIAGFTLKGCVTPAPRPSVAGVVRDTVRFNLDSIRAEIRAELRAEIRPGIVRDTTLRDTVLHVVPDAEAARMAEELWARIDSLIAANDSIADVTATALTSTPEYDLRQSFSVRRRQFGHHLTIYKADTVRTELCPPPTFWDQVQEVGFWAGLGAIAYAFFSLFAQ